jgi:hypothetical protein
MKDFFISYNSADKYWAEWIAWQLEETGYTIVIQAWDSPYGQDFIKWIHKGITNQSERSRFSRQLIWKVKRAFQSWNAMPRFMLTSSCLSSYKTLRTWGCLGPLPILTWLDWMSSAPKPGCSAA